MRSSPTAAGYLALIVALSLSSGCVQTIPLTPTSPEAAGLAGRWTGKWRSDAVSARFTLELARGSGDRLAATAVWYGLPTVRREFTGTLANGQLILGDPKTNGLTLTDEGHGTGPKRYVVAACRHSYSEEDAKQLCKGDEPEQDRSDERRRFLHLSPLLQLRYYPSTGTIRQ